VKHQPKPKKSHEGTLRRGAGLPQAGLHYCPDTSGLQGRHSFRVMLSQKDAPRKGLTCTKGQEGSRDFFISFLAWEYLFPKHGSFCSIFFPQKIIKEKSVFASGDLWEEFWS